MASLVCHISVSETYKVAWVRVGTQTVLSYNDIVITKNHRIRVSQPEPTVWKLFISDIKRRDAGYYMCQVNTDPMRSRRGYLEVQGDPCVLPLLLPLTVCLSAAQYRGRAEL